MQMVVKTSRAAVLNYEYTLWSLPMLVDTSLYANAITFCYTEYNKIYIIHDITM